MNWRFWQKKDKKIEYSSVVPLSEEEYAKCDLPDVYTSAIVTYGFPGSEMRTHILLGLPKMEFICKEFIVDLVIYTRDLHHLFADGQNLHGFQICISDDPSLEFAGDWMQMGCNRIMHSIDYAVVHLYDDKIVLTGNVSNYHAEVKPEIVVDKV